MTPGDELRRPCADHGTPDGECLACDLASLAERSARRRERRALTSKIFAAKARTVWSRRAEEALAVAVEVAS